MNAAHHLTQVCAAAAVAERVIVIVDERRDPWREIHALSPMLKAIPEDRLRAFGCEGEELIAAAGGDEPGYRDASARSG